MGCTRFWGRDGLGRVVVGRGHPQGVPLRGLPGVVGYVVFGAEVEDVLFVFVVFAVGVEGVDADAVDVGEVVDFDLFAGEGVEAEVDGGLGAFGMFGGEFGEAGDPGAEAGFAVSADVVDLESVFDFAELDGVAAWKMMRLGARALMSSYSARACSSFLLASSALVLVLGVLMGVVGGWLLPLPPVEVVGRAVGLAVGRGVAVARPPAGGLYPVAGWVTGRPVAGLGEPVRRWG